MKQNHQKILIKQNQILAYELDIAKMTNMIQKLNAETSNIVSESQTKKEMKDVSIGVDGESI